MTCGLNPSLAGTTSPTLKGDWTMMFGRLVLILLLLEPLLRLRYLRRKRKCGYVLILLLLEPLLRQLKF